MAAVDVVTSVQNHPYNAWQAMLLHYTCCKHLRRAPLVVVHAPREQPLDPGFERIREAGGRISDFQGGDGYLESGSIIAGNPKIYAALSKLLAPHARDLP